VKTKNIKKLKKEAFKLMEESEDNVTWRTCWNCNPAHERLKSVDNAVILCLNCGHWFFKGIDITEEDNV